MSERGSRNTANINNSHIVGGRGTHNRPWIIEDTDGANGDSNDRPTNTRTSAQQQQQQEQHQSLRLKRNQSLSTSEHGGVGIPSHATDRTRSYIRQSSPHDRTSSTDEAHQRRASTSDIRSVASGDSGSSYDRYLAQKRATKELHQHQQQQQQQSTASTTLPPSQIRQSSTQRHSVAATTNESLRDRSTTSATSIRSQQPQPPPPTGAPVSPVLEKHYTNDGKAMLIAPSKREMGVNSRRRLIGTIPLDDEHNESKRNIATSSMSTNATLKSSTQGVSVSGTASNRIRRPTYNAEEEESSNMTSRDLRARRLVASQQSRAASNSNNNNSSSSNSSSRITSAMTDTPTVPANSSSHNTTPAVPLHFQAHDAAVEKYLMRSRLSSDPGRSRTSVRKQDHMNSAAMHIEIPKLQQPDELRPPIQKTSSRARSDGTVPVPVPISHHISSKTHSDGVNARTSATQRANGIATQQSKVATSNVETRKIPDETSSQSMHGENAIQPQTGWSTMKAASTTGYHNVTTEAIVAHDAYNADTARVTTPVAPLGSGSAKVDQYLAQRNALKAKVESYTRIGKQKHVEVDTVVNETPPIVSVPSTSVSLEDSTDDESDEASSDSEHVDAVEDKLENEYMEDPVLSDSQKEWSVKVCVISAIDFPASVVPNLPFSPMLKLGLIKLDSTETTDQKYRELAKDVEVNGLSTIPHSRVRCTSSKILSKRDNGSVEFHEEIRWNRVHDPQHTALALELSSRAVLQPANFRESPQQQKIGPFLLSSSIHASTARPNSAVKPNTGREAAASVIGSMFRTIRKTESAEMEEANAAAAVAKHLVRGELPADALNSHLRPSHQFKSESQSEVNVKLRRRKDAKRVKISEEFRIGSKIIPLTQLSLNDAIHRHETVRLEQWFELDTCTNTVKTSLVGTSPSLSTATRNPSILLEISFSAREMLDDSEDDMDEGDSKVEMKASYSKRASLKIRKQLKQEVKPRIEKAAEPVLEPGIIDFISIVGARDIGDQKNDDGSSGWVDSTPDCCILEQFPPDDEFHAKRGRNAVLAGKIEWFCFPEGCKLWRGLTPPNYDELNLKRFSAATSGNIASSIATFDASLGCTTSFSWFVIASSSDKYGSENKKTYCAVIRFYVPAPAGIDPTQDDFAQTYIGHAKSNDTQNNVKRLWVPMGICMTSSLPIVGTMEVMLLRLCESLSMAGYSATTSTDELKSVREALLCTIVSYQKPIPGVVNCSFPFLKGDPLNVAIPSRTGLPPLPHGSSVSAVCRLLGADGLNFLLAAFLTECKILLHSDDIANLSMVAEVLSALIYPFEWALPYVPVLPVEMMEFIEAPVSYLIGVPSCNICHADPSVLEDVVVVDLDRDFATSDYFEGRRNGLKTKSPIPLPAAVASNIAKAAHRLIRVDDEIGAARAQSLPRLEPETIAEKEFRIAVALEVCGLIRGFDECLVFTSSQPVFNVDKFLQIAPSIFEEQRDAIRDQHGHIQGSAGSRNVISPRSRRFVSSLVCCQHFHQFLDVLEAESLTFFHVIMRTIHANRAKKEKSLGGMLLSLESNQGSTDLCQMLTKVEEKTPTYRVKSLSGQWGTIVEGHPVDEVSSISHFPLQLLQQINIHDDAQMKDSSHDAVKSISVEYLVELEKTPWKYRNIFNFRSDATNMESSLPFIEKVKLREAIGDRRYKAWKAGYDKFDGDDGTIISEETMGLPNALDLRSLLSAADENVMLNVSANDGDAAVNAKDREALRRCLECSNKTSPEFYDLLEAAQTALQNPVSKRFMLSILSQRTRKEEQKKNESTPVRRRSLHYGGSKIDATLFELLLQLSFAMLDSCDESKDFDTAYQLLKHTAGLYAAISEIGTEVNVVYVTERVGLHPIYGNLALWESVKATHSNPRQISQSFNNTKIDNIVEGVDDEYEGVVATLYEMNGYGIPAKDLARFASRMCYINGWFHSEKGQTLLMLAKRVCVRRDIGFVTANASTLSDLALISQSPRQNRTRPKSNMSQSNVGEYKWIEIGWCHPAAQSSRRSDTNRRAGQSIPLKVADEVESSQSDNPNNSYMKRSAVTSLAYLGSSVCVTGGLDGGVFLARAVRSSTTKESSGTTFDDQHAVRGLHLDWGSSGSRYAVGSAATTMDGEYGVGAVTCLAATQSTIGGINSKTRRSSTKDVFDEPLEDEKVLEAMEGCRVVAGTTCGDLRVWSIKDVFTAVFYANRSASDAEPAVASKTTAVVRSAKVQNKSTDFAAGSSLTRLKFSLRGRALSGHRGGVSCIIVHSNVYRPDSIVSGGADGLIKLWSLRTPGTSGGRRSSVDPGAASGMASSSSQYRTASGSNGGVKGGTAGASTGDALSILSGHGGRIICIKTAWHGDRLLSGGADRTVRLWDLASGSGGKCLNTLSGHFGWVTNVDFWGQNTIISTSTDRSIGIWDVRVGNSPLFILRHHYAPVSNFLLEPYCDATLVSAATDGSVASWDLRQLSVMNELSNDGTHPKSLGTRIVRTPSAIRSAQPHSFRRPEVSFGSIYLTKGSNLHRRTVQCLGGDTIVREWDYRTGEILQEDTSGHCDTISGFVGLANDKVLGSQLESVGPDNADATLSASWDGTVRLRNRIVM